ncbi:DNA cytosine methyltransferase [Marinobacter alexandrii]|uniref:DNA cytosine methyltransferase n=1 Tax=Marinobacter alexandrii TaxID=2570351 RepID=UPI001FFFAD4D|nr:DNA cytosine methyltransferase [Marinobacter alexandrii]MCK2148744.1 DNA cytosine methyltransferase [Marinobacter alexandrii]
MEKLKVVSLFSGAMGLDIGFHKTGKYDLLACVEKEPVFCETIRANVEAGHIAGEPRVYCEDLSNFEPEQLMADLGLRAGDVDLVIGGPPCQAFSTAGKRQSVLDHRGTLLWRFLRFVEVLQPKVFVMENVRGLTSAALRHRKLAERPDKGGAPLEQDELPGSVLRQFAVDLQKFSDPAYRMDAFEVNSVNYGAPQIRERLIVVGNRLGLRFEFPSPTHSQTGERTGTQSSLFEDEEPLQKWATLRDAIYGIEEVDPVILDFSPRKKSFLSLVPEGANWRALPIELQQESMKRAWHAKGGRSGWWRRLTWDLPSPTLITMPNHASTSLCHPTETRALTLTEYKRIQEFPPNWIVCGTAQQQYTQIGNAVPTRLGQVAAEHIFDVLSDPQKYRASADEDFFRLVYVQSHIRTRRWFKDGEALVWTEDNKHEYGQPKTLTRSMSFS